VTHYLTSCKILSAFTKIWPNPHELKVCANKLELTANLETIASGTTNTRRPLVTMVSDDVIQEGHLPPELTHFVLKRTHSETGNHVIQPDVDPEERHRLLSEPISIPEAQWFMQSHVKYLLDAGEIRMFFVGLKNIYNVHTIKDPEKDSSEWTFDYVEKITPLDVFA
jgi:hypothetical protein